ncbi:hypothetical protein AMECASPLE_001733, partial [Ameca splendens]
RVLACRPKRTTMVSSTRAASSTCLLCPLQTGLFVTFFNSARVFPYAGDFSSQLVEVDFRGITV